MLAYTRHPPVWAALLVLALALVLPAGAAGSFPGQNGVIAYSATVGPTNPETAIWAVDPATGYQLRLTSGAYDRHPTFAPSGSILAFERFTAIAGPLRNPTVFVVRADGSGPRALVAGSEPAFSPDGSRVLFVRNGAIYAIGLTPGSVARKIVAGPGDSAPQWSPTGTIAFERSHIVSLRDSGHIHRALRNDVDLLSSPRARRRSLITFERGPRDPARLQPVAFRLDWSPDARALSLSVCAEPTSLPPSSIPTVPHLVLATGCRSQIWAPAGTGLVSLGPPGLAGLPNTTCPHDLTSGTELAYQPLHGDTLRVPVKPCEAVPEPERSERASSSPPPTPGSRTCYFLGGRRHCHPF